MRRVFSTLGLVIFGGMTMGAFAEGESVDFHGVLKALGRSPEISDSEDLYGWLVGSWELDVRHYWVDVSGSHVKGEVHCGWVLEGRAVQDVWIMPQRSDRSGGVSKNSNMYGTTLRVWDPAIKAWRITWINPVSGGRLDQVGRKIGKDIVQLGAGSDGITRRWMFTEITPDSFHWTGEALEQDGKTWKLEGEFRARRIH